MSELIVSQNIEFRHYKAGEPVDLTLREGVRALLVSRTADGGVSTQEVRENCSVLDIKKDLITHIRECPMGEQWHEELLEFLITRKRAHKKLRDTGGAYVGLNERLKRWTVTYSGMPVAMV